MRRSVLLIEMDERLRRAERAYKASPGDKRKSRAKKGPQVESLDRAPLLLEQLSRSGLLLQEADEAIRRLERAYAASPGDERLRSRLIRARERAGLPQVHHETPIHSGMHAASSGRLMKLIRWLGKDHPHLEHARTGGVIHYYTQAIKRLNDHDRLPADERQRVDPYDVFLMHQDIGLNRDDAHDGIRNYLRERGKPSSDKHVDRFFHGALEKHPFKSELNAVETLAHANSVRVRHHPAEEGGHASYSFDVAGPYHTEDRAERNRRFIGSMRRMFPNLVHRRGRTHVITPRSGM